MFSPILHLITFILGVSAQKPSTNPALLTPGLNDGLCLTATSQSNGAAVDVETCAGRPEQIWNFANGAVSTFGGNKCLDVTNGDHDNGTPLQVWDCVSGNANQQWYYTTDKRIAWTNQTKCLDLTDGKAQNGTKIQIWDCTDNDNYQLWNAAKPARQVYTPSFFWQST